MLNNYLKILQESLDKKLLILGQIEEIDRAQAEILKQDEIDLEAFDKTVDEKDGYVKELSELDEGFESLYDRIKEELLRDKKSYTDQIKHLQKQIGEITDKSVSIQAQESRNKSLLENYFLKQRSELGRARKSTKAAYGYYQNMSGTAAAASHFMDKKK